MQQSTSTELPWMREAKHDLAIGVVEMKDGDNPIILGYLAMCTHLPEEMKKHDETAWCAAAVGAWLLRAGIESTRSAAARSYLDFGVPVDGYPTGAIAVLARSDDANKNAAHVGLIASAARDHIVLLGGNQGNRVSLELRPKSRVIACRWPRGVPLPV